MQPICGYGYRISQCVISVIESHPDNAHEDLRLDRPFPGLIQFCDSINMQEMSKKVR